MNKDLLKVSIRQNAIYLPLIEEEKKQGRVDFDYHCIGSPTP